MGLGRARSVRTLEVVGAAMVVALFAGAVGSVEAASKPCTEGPIAQLTSQIYDYDLDGYDDAFSFDVEYAPSAGDEAWFNVSVLAPDGSPVGQYNSGHLNDPLNYTHDHYDFALQNFTDANGTYGVEVTYDYTDGTCQWSSYTFDLRPPGNYVPAVEGAVLDKTSDQNTTVDFALTVRNGGNNPDTLVFAANGSEGWAFSLDLPNASLEPGATAALTVTVAIPPNAAPLTVNNFNLSVTSLRNPLRAAHIEFWARVSAQRFGLDLRADNTSLEGLPNAVISFDLHLTNTGNNRDFYDVGVPAPPPPWQMTAPESFGLFVGQEVAFTVSVRLPYILWDPWWNFTVNVTAGDHVTNASLALHAKLILPDFVVAAAGIAVNVTAPDPGAAVSVQVTVLNLGAPVSVTFAVTLFAGSANFTGLVDMTPLGSAVATFFNWSAPPGSITLQAFADSTNSVPEDNESNNRGALTITANVPPTAVAATASATARIGEPVNISAAGSSDPDGAITGFYFEFGDGFNSGWVTEPIVSHSYNIAKNYTVTIHVRDNHGTLSEPATEVITVTEEGPSGGGGGGGGGPGGNETGAGSSGAGAGSTLALVIVAGAIAVVIAAWVVRNRSRREPPQGPGAPPPGAP
jgi:PKD repeat protein